MMRTASLLLPMLVLLGGVDAAMAQESGRRPETSCVVCHGSQSGRLGEPFVQWRQSIHADNGVACHDCHGGDPTVASMEAMSPERGFLGVPAEEAIPAFCGRCHVGVEEDYRGSAHGKALGQGGPQCVTCHGNHAVLRASPELINERDCSRCHSYGRAEEIKAAVVQTDTLINSLQAALPPLRRLGIATKGLQDEIFAVRNDFHRLFHSVDVDRVRQQSAAFEGKLNRVGAEVAAIEETLKRRRLAGAAAVGGLVLAGVLLLLLRRTYEGEGGQR